ncbi:MAG: Gfo/Idh/MocA family oxidoreductase [Clostridia bacterium]|nr:Gfo/Idh/MocA family oxidoreductase [Clostridia bacterium]
MAKNILNIAVIGCSGMAKLHMEGVLKNDKACLYGICDIAPERLEPFKEHFPNCKKYVTDYREFVNDPEVDAVVIVTPDQVHLEQTAAFLRAGKAVLCEKPMALNMEECQEMMRIEKETNGKLMVGQICRHTPGFIEAKKLIDEGKIGELVFVEREYAHNYTHARGYNDWRVVPERHGFIGGGCHAVDLLRWIAGDPTEVYAHANHKIMLDWPTDDTVISIYKFPNGVSGKVFVSIGCKRNYTMRSVFYGTKGTIITDNTSPEITLFTELGEDGDFTKEIKVPVDINNHNATAEIEAFVDALVNGKPMPVSSKEGAYTVAVCCAAVESSKVGKPIDIVYPKADR